MQISFSPAAVVVPQGAEFSLVVTVAGARDLGQLSIEMEWVGDALEYRSFGGGDLLAGSGQRPTFEARRTGLRKVQLDTRLPAGFGASGSGAVGLGRFRAKNPGESALRILSVQALDAQGVPIQVEHGEALIQVQP